MVGNTDRLIDIIEDHVSYEVAFRIIREAAETHVLPPEGVLPMFNDPIAYDDFTATLELVTGKKYE